MPEPVKQPVQVEVDSHDLQLRLRDYYLALAAAVGGFTVEDLTLSVKLKVNGEDTYPKFELVVADEYAAVTVVVLKQESEAGNYWYVINATISGSQDYVAEQYRLHCSEEQTHLEVAAFVAALN